MKEIQTHAQLELISEPFHLGVVWEFIARTKTAGGHLYWGTKEDGSEISAPGRIAGDVPTRHLGPDP